MPRVSIIVPVKDQTASLKTTLQAFNCQEGVCKDDLEIVVVDDGETLPVDFLPMSNFCNGIDISIVKTPGYGRAKARNIGVSNSTGNLLVFCDADRIPDPFFVAQHMRIHITNDRVVIGNPKDLYYRGQTGDQISYQKYSRVSPYYRFISNLYEACEDNTMCTVSRIAWLSMLIGNSSMMRATYDEAGGLDCVFKKWGLEHFEFGYRLQCLHKNFVLNSVAVSYHQVHARKVQDMQAGLNEGLRIIHEKHSIRYMDAVRECLVGKMSLQELRRIAGDECVPATIGKLLYFNNSFWG